MACAGILYSLALRVAAIPGGPTLEEMRKLTDTSADSTTPLSRKATAAPLPAVPQDGRLTRMEVLAMVADRQASKDAIRAIGS